jgi:hypothetical protein
VALRKAPTEHIHLPSFDEEKGRSIQARGVALKILKFLAIILTAVYLIPGGAHLFALLNKIDLAADQYLVVQGTYRGWHYFGYVIIAAIIVDITLVIMLRRHRAGFAAAVIAAGCMIGSLAIFFFWVFPANVATSFWTAVPDNWQALRQHWEFGHAASALITFASLCSVTVAALVSRE